jgi:cyclin H
MTFHPTDILKTALFFATKVENYYISLTKFEDAIEKTKPEDVLGSELLLIQGLKFTFDVRHPFWALEGVVMELQALSRGEVPALLGGDGGTEERPRNVEKRARDAHGKAREYLKTSILLTDVYFHFTPSQIMMAALMIADKALTEWYIKCKFPAATRELQKKVLDKVERCSDLLREIDQARSLL